MDGVRTAIVIWIGLLAAPLTGGALGGWDHAAAGLAVAGVALGYVCMIPMLFTHFDTRVWAWRTTKAVGALPAAATAAWMGIDAPHDWTTVLPFASIGGIALFVGGILVVGTAPGRAFQRATWLPPIDADRAIQEIFACACWDLGVEPSDLERTLEAGGDTVKLRIDGEDHRDEARRQALRAARNRTLETIRHLHRGRLWPEHWANTTESPDIGGMFALDQALARGEGLLPALTPSAHQRLAIRARHF